MEIFPQNAMYFLDKPEGFEILVALRENAGQALIFNILK